MSKNNMVCDLETGVCGEVGEDAIETINLNQPQKKITLYYVTDPICSHCWALEPVLRRFEKQYGQYIKFQTVMGGLLPNWDGFADRANGIGSPADVAGHWREVGEHTRMPIDGTLWLDNPIQSSFPPSRVFKVIQQQSEELANTYLRRAREAVFAFNKNIADDQVLIDLVNQMGLDGESIVKEAALESSQQLLEQDFALAGSLGVRGFPTVIMVNEENKGVKIVGQRSLEFYAQGLQQVLETAEPLQPQPLPTLKSLLEKEELLFSREIEDMYDIKQSEVSSYLQEQLSSDEYQLSEILGEVYIEKR
ncbi:DsbA family protein [Metabacillus rhizolycopersici]|uniref:DsbA family protein n=1 Tax=Metabacillus rhizolycopersici TaxID=2875709 RepID=A0ABS7UWK0_9BACI|nr:DsbA family protein [Metabacillus rhizolycopersici]MBZ5752358.1 DsbA family protein [Metabacillus rhizolycopersici]